LPVAERSPKIERSFLPFVRPKDCPRLAGRARPGPPNPAVIGFPGGRPGSGVAPIPRRCQRRSWLSGMSENPRPRPRRRRTMAGSCAAAWPRNPGQPEGTALPPATAAHARQSVPTRAFRPPGQLRRNLTSPTARRRRFFFFPRKSPRRGAEETCFCSAAYAEGALPSLTGRGRRAGGGAVRALVQEEKGRGVAGKTLFPSTKIRRIMSPFKTPLQAVLFFCDLARKRLDRAPRPGPGRPRAKVDVFPFPRPSPPPNPQQTPPATRRSPIPLEVALCASRFFRSYPALLSKILKKQKRTFQLPSRYPAGGPRLQDRSPTSDFFFIRMEREWMPHPSIQPLRAAIPIRICENPSAKPINTIPPISPRRPLFPSPFRGNCGNMRWHAFSFQTLFCRPKINERLFQSRRKGPGPAGHEKVVQPPPQQGLRLVLHGISQRAPPGPRSFIPAVPLRDPSFKTIPQRKTRFRTCPRLYHQEINNRLKISCS